MKMAEGQVRIVAAVDDRRYILNRRTECDGYR
jgi:hypothetical protein